MSYSLPEELDLENRRRFFRNYDRWVQLFPQQLVDGELINVPVSNLVDIDKVIIKELDRAPGRGLRNPGNYYGVHDYLGRATTYTHIPHRHSPEYERVGPALCDFYLIPHRYQGLCHGKMLRNILGEIAPFTRDYKLGLYELNFYDKQKDEFYVNLSADYSGHRSLYVPYVDFLYNDIPAIQARNESYLRWYTHSDEVWQSIQEDEVCQRFLQDVEDWR